MTSSIDTPPRSADPRPEAERQLAAALERHREVLASMQPGSWRDVREL